MLSVQPAPVGLREAIQDLITRQMADELIGKADLSKPDECRASLLATGFGQTSVDALASRAISIAEARARVL